jgi:sensor histidine kinase YesM
MLRTSVITALFCVAIAVLLALIGMADSFWVTLTISLSIGLSINTAFTLLSKPAERSKPWYLGPIVITAIGLGIGLTIAGTLVRGDPWLFFSSDYSVLVIGIFFGVVGFLTFSTRHQLLQARAQLAEAEAARVQQQRRMLETELRLLQAQIEPHFLFNTLGTIASLIRTDPGAAEAVLHNLSRLLRASLRRTRGQSTTLADELEIVTAYLDIQKVRMGPRLKVDLAIPKHLKPFPLPPLLLQPLVENAVVHGLEGKVEGGTVRVEAEQNGNRLLLRVVDTGTGVGSLAPGAGVGIRNIRERLAGLFGTAAALELLENPEGGIIAELKLPLSAP